MKLKLLALAAMAALSLPAMAQQVYFGPGVNNGDFETGATIAPFNGIASSHSTGVIPDHTTGLTTGGVMSVDLTANNGEGQWKLLTTPDLVDTGYMANVETDVNAGLAFSGEMWVYVPASAGLGNTPTAVAQVKIEPSYDGGSSYVNADGNSTVSQINLTTAATDTWHRVGFDKVLMPAGVTHVRTRAWFISTLATVNGVAADSAAPADWTAEGYSGFVYFDDFKLESVLPPDPNFLICDDIRNGDLETGDLSSWAIQSAAGSIGTAPGDPVYAGNHSLGFDVAVNGDGNRWKQFNNIASGPAAAGDRFDGQVWIYLPSTTVVDPSRGRFSFQTRSNNGNAAQGRIGQTFVDIRPGNHPTDVWTPHTWQHIAVDGSNTISSVNTGGWFLETQSQADTDSNGYTYSGLVYLDDFKLVNIGPPTPGVLIDDSTFNGDLEAPSINPWVVTGAASLSTTINHTPGGTQSACVDLTANNGTQQWKGLHNATIEQPIENYTRADVSAWVYIPAATTFGTTALFNLPIRDGAVFETGGPSLDLTAAARDTWVEVSAIDINVSSFTTSLAVNNWNVETVTLVGLPGSLVRSDGSDGTLATGDDSGADLVGPAVPQDWIDSGYSGVFYFDDIDVRLHSPVDPEPIVINSISYDGTDVVINYNTIFDEGGFSGVDIYYSTDLVNWTADVFVTASGNNLEVTRPSGDAARYYIFVQPGVTPDFGNFDPPPATEG